METNIISAPCMVKRLINRMQLLPLVERCTTEWPTKQDIQLMLPDYISDLRNLHSTLKNDPSQLRESGDEDMLNFHATFISICFESTAFILSEELAAEIQFIRDMYIWNKLMHFSTRKKIVSLMFNQYRKTLLGEDWFYNFGNLSSFWGFAWDLLEFDRDISLIDRNVVEVIELVSFRLLRSKSIQLFVKGVTVLEECIYKTRGYSLMNYEMIYEELLKHTWRLSSEDERNQQASIILLAAMLECVRVLEVERNELMTLSQNFVEPSRADSMIEIILKGLKASWAMSKRIDLLDILLQLLSIDHNIRLVSEELLDDLNNNEPNNSDGWANFSLFFIKGTDKIELDSVDWWQDVIVSNIGRFHRWTKKLLRELILEIDKFENFNAVHYQYLSCIFFFLIRSEKMDKAEQFEDHFELLVTFVKRMVNRLEPLIASVDETTYSSLRTCKLLAKANVECLKSKATLVHQASPNEIGASHMNIESRQSKLLNKLSLSMKEW